MLTALSRAERGVTQAIVNADLQPTASFVMNPDIDFEMNAMQGALREAIGENKLDIIDATGIASALMGDSIATNAFMLGFAFQKGAIPLSLEAILRAIEINGAAVEMNKQAFSWGRLAAHDLARVRSVTQFRARAPATCPRPRRRDRAPRRISGRLSGQAYARALSRHGFRGRKAEAAAAPGSSELTEAVAKNLFKLMAYKDEYEVARLYTDGALRNNGRAVRRRCPPQIPSRAAAVRASRQGDRRPQKSEYGGWTIHLFHVLARLKFCAGPRSTRSAIPGSARRNDKLIADYRGDAASAHAGAAKPRFADVDQAGADSRDDPRLRIM